MSARAKSTKRNIYNSKTKNWQRIAIWMVAIVMGAGTLLGMFFMVFASQNPDVDPSVIASKKQQEAYEAYLNGDEYKQLLADREEAKTKLRGLDGYAEYVTAFTAADVTELKVETLKEGDGATVVDKATLSVNYTGWTPDGKIFDSTKSEGKNASPTSLSLTNVIEGWSKGLVGKKAGGVYLLSIPSDLAYDESGSSDGAIAANTPIKYLVQIVSSEKAS